MCAVCTGSLAEELTALDLQIRQARERELERATHARIHAEDMLFLATAASEGIEAKIVEAHDLARNLDEEATQLKCLNDSLRESLSLKVSEQAVQAEAVERLQMTVDSDRTHLKRLNDSLSLKVCEQAEAVERLQMTLDCERQALMDARRESEQNLERLAIIARQKRELAASALSLDLLIAAIALRTRGV